MRGAVLVVMWALCEVARSHYTFFRSLPQRQGGRVFGGTDARSGTWPAACALLNRALLASCSCSVLAPRWALTAAHCAVPAVVYVQYNGREPAESSIAAVYLRYTHPEFQVLSQDRGYGVEVVVLRNDVGMVRTREDMLLFEDDYVPLNPHFPDYSDRDPARVADPVSAISRYDVNNLFGAEISVLGFVMTDQHPAGERLREVHLRLAACAQEGWPHCACAHGPARGVCAGDSGGPVLYNGTQIGVISLGPLECGAARAPALEVRSVFTALRPYAEAINATLRDSRDPLRMRVVRAAAAAPRPRPRSARLTLCALALLLARSLF